MLSQENLAPNVSNFLSKIHAIRKNNLQEKSQFWNFNFENASLNNEPPATLCQTPTKLYADDKVFSWEPKHE